MSRTRRMRVFMSATRRAAGRTRPPQPVRASSRTSRAPASSEASASACAAVTRSVAATRAAPSVPSAPASGRAASTSAPVKREPGGAALGHDDDVDLRARHDERGRAGAGDLDRPLAAAHARGPRGRLVLELARAEVGAARDRRDRPAAEHLPGNRGRPDRRVAGRDAAEREVGRREAAARRQVTTRHHHVDEWRELRPDRRLAAPDVGRRQAAEGQREADEQRAAAAPRHRSWGRGGREGGRPGSKRPRSAGIERLAARQTRTAATAAAAGSDPGRTAAAGPAARSATARATERRPRSGARGRGRPRGGSGPTRAGLRSTRRRGRRSPGLSPAPRPRRRRDTSTLTGAGEARPRVAHLHAHPPGHHAAAHAHRPAAVLDRVRHEVAARLREAHRVGADQGATAHRLDDQRRAERGRQRSPGLGGVVEQGADVDQLRACARAPPAPRRDQVLQRQRRPPQLGVDRRGALVIVEPVQAQARRAQRPAQLVAGVGHQLRVARQPQPQPRRADRRAQRGRPARVGGRAHAASSSGGPSTSR